MMHVPLVNPKNIFPPLHIKLGLIKNFVKAMDHLGEGFKHIGYVNVFTTKQIRN